MQLNKRNYSFSRLNLAPLIYFYYSTPTLDSHKYHKLSDRVFDSLSETLESVIEEGGFEIADTAEVEYNVCLCCQKLLLVYIN